VGYERAQLRISTWPGGTVPEVHVLWQPVELHDREPLSKRNEPLAKLGISDPIHEGSLADPHRDLHFDREQEDLTYVELPNELVLRGLLELDIDDPNAVCAFLWAHGCIGTPFQFPRPGFIYPIFDPSPTLADVRAFLLLARTLALHWIAHKEGRDLVEPWRMIADLWADDRTNPLLTTEGDPWAAVEEAPQHAEDAWIVFVTLLNEGLRAYQARAEYIPDEFLDTHTTIGGPDPDLYSGLCLQLLNIVTEDLPVLRCANTNCKRVFLRQEGRAEKGQHRTTGVMYCSRQCARAQANRNYRQRQRKGRR